MDVIIQYSTYKLNLLPYILVMLIENFNL